MEDLLRSLIQRAESCGGAEWLRRCLEDDAVPSVSSMAVNPQPQHMPIESQGETDVSAPPAALRRNCRRNKGKRSRNEDSPSSPVDNIVLIKKHKSRSPDRASFTLPQAAAAGTNEVVTRGQPGGVDSNVGENFNIDFIELGKVIGSLANVLARFNSSKNIGTVWNGGGLSALNLSDNVSLLGNPAIPGNLNVNDNTVVNSNSTPNTVSVVNPMLSKAVSESCLKEALPCELSSLGFHLSSSVKEKIWRGEFIDILSLLPASKEFLQRSDKRIDDRSEEDRRRAVPRSFQNWLQSFCIFASVMGERFPSKCSGLFQHLDIVAEAYRHFGGSSWYSYDESFRQMLSVHPSLRWGLRMLVYG